MTQALDGIRVLDLAPLLPGSLCTQMLADLGVEVIKIESPHGGDNFRSTPPLVRTTGSFFHIMNRNKKGMKLDLKHPRGRDLFIRIASKSDMIIENFRPGMMRQMGLGYDDLKKVNGGLIYCSLTGFGQDGPYSQSPAGSPPRPFSASTRWRSSGRWASAKMSSVVSSHRELFKRLAGIPGPKGRR